MVPDRARSAISVKAFGLGRQKHMMAEVLRGGRRQFYPQHQVNANLKSYRAIAERVSVGDSAY